MAFGKNDSNIKSMPGFRGQVKQQQAARPKYSGGGGAYWVNRYQPSTDESDTIRLIKGNYEVEIGQQDGTIDKVNLYYFPYIEHFHATKQKSGFCSAGPLGMFKGKGQPCLGCEEFWADKNAGKKNGPMSRRELSAFTVMHFAPYAKVEQVDDQGQVKKNDQGVPYYNWERVLPHERAKYKDKEMRDFHILHWSVGFGHLNNLMAYDKLIGKSCKSCGGRDCITCEAWCCSHCGEALIEPATTHFSPKEVEELTGKEVRCAACQQSGMLNEIISCSSCTNPVRAEIFDVDLKIMRVKSPDPNNNVTTILVESWSNPRPVDQRYAAEAKSLPLDKTFAATDMEKQQQNWGGGSRAPVTAGQLSRPYGGGPPVVGGSNPAGGSNQ